MNAKHIIVPNVRNHKNIVAGVIDPESMEIVSLENWSKDPNPTRAEFVAVYDGVVNRGIIIPKHQLQKTNFETAQKDAMNTIFNGFKFRCPTREDCALIYDARFHGLDDALEIIGGDNLDRWIWTNETDPDPEYSSRGAFAYSGQSGGTYGYDRYNAYNVRPVLPFKFPKL